MRDSAAGTVNMAVAPPVADFPNIQEDTVRSVAWDQCGILRDANGLSDAVGMFDSVEMHRGMNASRSDFEARNMLIVAQLIARCALAREESRGGHYRLDFPEARPEFRKHSIIERDGAATFTE